MFIPLRTNRPAKRRPIVTQSLIIVNMLVYLIGLVGESGGAFDRETLVNFGHLGRTDFHAWQLVTYQFLHDPSGIWHLAFNMLFLWVFGAAVEDRLGRLSFLGFYLVGGAVAGVAHMMFEAAPVIGASGSIAGVTGAFLALFPRARIQILFVFFIIGLYQIPALWFVGIFFVIDLLSQVGSILGKGGGGVAYMAHIAGYLYGFGLAFTLLAIGIVKREEFDVFYLMKQWRRRAAFRAASRTHPGGLWESASADTSRRLEQKAVEHKAKVATPPTAEEQKRLDLRTEAGHLVTAHRLPEAAAQYRDLLAVDPGSVLSETHQLDVANQLQAEEDFEHAAQAYELLLDNYPTCASAAEVRLILGVIYARRLNRLQRARELIEAARARLTDAQHQALAGQLLAEIGEP